MAPTALSPSRVRDPAVMELRHLRYFVAVAEELHFRRAAERLHVAQPAVSEQIRKLEAEIGVQLLARDQRSVALTPAGAAMLEEARRVLRQAEDAQRAAREAHDRALGRLRVGYVPDALPAAVPRLLRRFAAQRAGRRRDARGRPLAAAARGRARAAGIDMAVVCLPAPVAGLRAVRIAHERGGGRRAGRPSVRGRGGDRARRTGEHPSGPARPRHQPGVL